MPKDQKPLTGEIMTRQPTDSVQLIERTTEDLKKEAERLKAEQSVAYERVELEHIIQGGFQKKKWDSAGQLIPFTGTFFGVLGVATFVLLFILFWSMIWGAILGTVRAF